MENVIKVDGFLGMFVNDSDHVKNRITSEDLTGSIKKRFNKH